MRATCLVTLFLLLLAVPAFAQTELVPGGDFENVKNGADLRKDGKGPDWYESRKDGKEGSGLLKLSKKTIAGNATKKAVVIAHPELNTYLSYRFTEPIEVTGTASFDIHVKEIIPGLKDYNRSAFIFLGGIKDKKGGPNSTGRERFVFLGFENGSAPGLINLFAREGQDKWADRTLIATGLSADAWHHIEIGVDVPEGYYEVKVNDRKPFELEAFTTKGRMPKRISHISFASWNDGPGTFYVDNVSVTKD